MSKLDNILPKVGQSYSDVFDAHTLAAGDVWDYIECIHLTDLGKQQIKDLMIALLNEVDKEAFRVGGSVNGNDLISQGFGKFKMAMNKKVNEL